ncbi:right-handed parallel beta-helix repeat-containing protein [Streptomyces sparsogenes]|uniref:right-handed parallel beta-helix repeat-containing protein n=1 Tax=Streptomyces sparsogenes TaxID=67365 RepID=UPI0033DB00BF
MRTRQLRYLAAFSVALVIELGPLPAAHAKTQHVVHPGESIQAAVEAAKPGDTIVIQPGTYRENVLITTSRLTLRGSGDKTVVKPPAKAARNPAKNPAKKNPAKKDAPRKTAKKTPNTTDKKTAGKTPKKTTGKVSGKAAENSCATAESGICVTGTAQRPVTGVRIRSLKVTGFAKNGIWGKYTDRMDVRGVTSVKNGQQGIGQEKSTRGTFRANTSKDNGQGGIFLANTVDEEGAALDTKGTVVRDNHLTGNRVGVGIRRLRVLTVQGNALTGNCGGVFVVGDEGTPRAGDLSVINNKVYENNKYCPPNPRLDFIQGTGILLTGVEDARVTGNTVRDNVGASPMSGGIVLFPSVVGTKNARNTIKDNVVTHNKPADLADRDAGPGNTFEGNTCTVSEPVGRCAKETS